MFPEGHLAFWIPRQALPPLRGANPIREGSWRSGGRWTPSSPPLWAEGRPRGLLGAGENPEQPRLQPAQLPPQVAAQLGLRQGPQRTTFSTQRIPRPPHPPAFYKTHQWFPITQSKDQHTYNGALKALCPPATTYLSNPILCHISPSIRHLALLALRELF